MKFSYRQYPKAYSFLGGAIASFIVAQFMKSDCARKLAVNSVAKGLKLKDDVENSIATIKEDAEDIFEEAKTKDKEGTNEV